jgi:hypothetical protein
MTPYEAVFGQKPRIGLATKVPRQLVENIMTGTLEEDMLEMLLDEDNEDVQVLNTEVSNNLKIFYFFLYFYIIS